MPPIVPDIICKFTIPSGQAGGKLSGGFLHADGTFYAANSGPTLAKNGNLRLVVAYPDADTAPQTLKGIFVFSAAPGGGATQPKATPFVSGLGRAMCLTAQEIAKDSSSGAVVYNFAPIPYKGDNPGHYELTFVAQNNNGGSPIQWAEDPEFDTGN